MASIICELQRLNSLLLTLGINYPNAISLFSDSQSTLHLANNLVFQERTKHIEVGCHFVRNAITDSLIAPFRCVQKSSVSIYFY